MKLRDHVSLTRMSYSNDVLAKGKSGKLELRSLHSRGSFVMCTYLDPVTLKPANRKTKLALRRRDGTIEEYFIIPLRNPKRSLLVTAEHEEKDRKVWNQQTKQEEDLWT